MTSLEKGYDISKYNEFNGKHYITELTLKNSPTVKLKTAYCWPFLLKPANTRQDYIKALQKMIELIKS